MSTPFDRTNSILTQLGLNPLQHNNVDAGTNQSQNNTDTLFLEPLTKDLQYLRQILLKVITQHDGTVIADKVKSLVDTSMKYRQSKSIQDFETLKQQVSELMQPEQAQNATTTGSAALLSTTKATHIESGILGTVNTQPKHTLPLDCLAVARALYELLNLANLADQHHRIRRWRLFERGTGQINLRQMPVDSFRELIKQGFTAEQISTAMAKQRIEYVITAHPTQSARRTLLSKYSHIAELLSMRDRTDLTPWSRRHIDEELERLVLSAWRSNTVRRVQPSPIDEARGGLAVVEDILWYAVPEYLRSVDDALTEINAPSLPYDVSTCSLASWIGGDRDGNPNVTHAVTYEVINMNRLRAADKYYKAVDELMWQLSMTTGSKQLHELIQQFEKDYKNVQQSNTEDNNFVYHAHTTQKPHKTDHHTHDTVLSDDFYRDTTAPDEPYRHVLAHIRERLYVTRKYCDYMSHGQIQRANEYVESRGIAIYTEKEQLMQPLRIIYRSLQESGDQLIADGLLRDTIRRVETFGLSLVKLDIRQESTEHSNTLTCITKYLNLGEYNEWSEEKRIEWLTAELQSNRPLFRWADFLHSKYCEPMAKEVLLTCATIAQCTESLGAYVISMCKRASDVLAVMLLQKESNVVNPLRVSPLFETQADLEASETIMHKLFSIEYYMNRIQGKQEIMLGYSDSAKDAGRITSVWSLYVAQEKLIKISQQYNVHLTLFHGRGGSVGRGGGPQHLAILSQPPGSIQNTLRITIQGETIEQHFGLRKIAQISLGRYSSATILATMSKGVPVKPEWRECMDQLSRDSSDAYRTVVQRTKNFIDYFRTATPVNELSDLKIGSRPAKRRNTGGIETLRAIPWIFSFTQTRLNVPVWLGVAPALKHQIQDGNEQILHSMVQQWPFFQSTVNLIEMVLAKSDTRISARYDELLVPQNLRKIGDKLRAELTECIDLVLKIKGDNQLLSGAENAVTVRSIESRHPFIDPINLLQAEVLKLIRNGEDDPICKDTLMITIQGIAAGMQNTG